MKKLLLLTSTTIIALNSVNAATLNDPFGSFENNISGVTTKGAVSEKGSTITPQTVTTSFGTADGFVTGAIGTSTIVDNLVTFSGGQQQQGVLGSAYNSGPAAYLFTNGVGGFNGFTNTGDNSGLISFGGFGATTVSFHAANLANGAATTFTSFDSSGNTLQTLLTQVDSLNGDDADEILTFTTTGGIYIDSIQVDLPGPNSNAPYAAAIDTFSATVAVPEPSSTLLVGLAFSASLLRRRRS